MNMQNNRAAPTVIKTKTKIRKSLSIFVLAVSILFTLTGCSSLSQTFGKDYVIIDNFYDQLNADIQYSAQLYLSSHGTEEQKNTFQSYLETIKANLQVSKNELKSQVPELKNYMKEIGYTGSSADYIQKALADARIKLEKKLSDETKGQFVLKHANVDRGFLGSIWFLVREHWIITLIIIGNIGAAWEKIQEYFESSKKRKEKSRDE